MGHCGFPINEMLDLAKNQTLESIRSIGPPEGLVYRVERRNKVDFLAKYVRPDFTPGIFLPNISGLPEVYNYPVYALY